MNSAEGDIAELNVPRNRANRLVRLSALNANNQRGSILKTFQKQFTKIRIDDMVSVDCPQPTQNHNLILISKHQKNNEEALKMLEQKEVILEVQAVTFMSMLSTFINICNCIIRYTVLEIPKTFAILGILNATVSLSVIGALSLFSLYFLLKAYEATGDK